mmetsp:Transcript_27847/g.36049  ORF Transcript_27847/g.36049 Transcript_27847/m.36049 type:complete len:93 (+) Transcript_27847:230-508(+)|eukprot:CAMPEP_0117890366 /NCGR_PEP_ID=MMETSP0950-20121206/23223_1 /TAXON_ID=44440 /ORGANISM="Chattonella subsalsa, Strain CCMP2191" /LENGTH=92 /DNA_ID=CAMNT_0005749491 /DNA_START=17 /DNA_END=295 /DNA_ORIENTATION=+
MSASIILDSTKAINENMQITMLKELAPGTNRPKAVTLLFPFCLVSELKSEYTNGEWSRIVVKADPIQSNGQTEFDMFCVDVENKTNAIKEAL